jgi:hypothetical protein
MGSRAANADDLHCLVNCCRSANKPLTILSFAAATKMPVTVDSLRFVGLYSDSHLNSYAYVGFEGVFFRWWAYNMQPLPAGLGGILSKK